MACEFGIRVSSPAEGFCFWSPWELMLELGLEFQPLHTLISAFHPLRLPPFHSPHFPGTPGFCRKQQKIIGKHFVAKNEPK
jgi:hypothetical protein